MKRVRLRFKPLEDGNPEGTLCYHVSLNGSTRQYATGYRVYEWEWDARRGEVSLLNTQRKVFLEALCEKVNHEMERINSIISTYSRRGIRTGATEIINKFKEQEKQLSLFNYMENLIRKYRDEGRLRTSETYRTALNSFKRYRKNKDLCMDAICGEMMEDYEAFLHSRGLIPNSSSFHLRTLRATYRRACEQGLIMPAVNPFARVYTGIDKTAKRAVDIETIRRIKNLDLSDDKNADYARDLFMLSFYMRGMSFIDIAYLRKRDLKNGFVTYRRRKTGQQLVIKWTSEMQAILNKYPENKTEYLFPVITSINADHRNQYRTRQFKVNSSLKTVGAKIGLTVPLTTYVARHSWASIAKTKGVDIGIISEGLGHENEKTTRIYLATLDTSAVDKANDLILSAL